MACATGAALGVVLAAALPASAHVTLHSYEAQQGGSTGFGRVEIVVRNCQPGVGCM
jgi:hypothetical protein